MTQEPSSQLDITTGRYPLSFTQQYFHSLNEGDLNGAFDSRVTIVSGLRIAGHVSVVEQDLPDFNAPHDDHRNSQFILGMYQGLSGEDEALPIGDGAREFFKQTLNTETSDIPSGIVWNMSLAGTGALVGDVTYNLDEFDEGKVTGWVSDYNRILSQLVSEPDREWRQLAGLSS